MSIRALLLAVGLLLLAAPGPSARAQAPDPARLAAAKEMMQLAGVAKQFDEIMPLLTAQIGQSFIALAPHKESEIREVFAQMTVKFTERKNELIDQIAILYAEQLGTEELGAIIAFYKSPAGTKFITVLPQIIRQSMEIGQRWGMDIGREIQEEARKELKKRGVDL